MVTALKNHIEGQYKPLIDLLLQANDVQRATELKKRMNDAVNGLKLPSMTDNISAWCDGFFDEAGNVGALDQNGLRLAEPYINAVTQLYDAGCLESNEQAFRMKAAGKEAGRVYAAAVENNR